MPANKEVDDEGDESDYIVKNGIHYSFHFQDCNGNVKHSTMSIAGASLRQCFEYFLKVRKEVSEDNIKP